MSVASVIDLRSDTLTQPSAGMRAAMTSASVGDDVYDEDPTVHELEARVAALLGHEAGLFTATGSLANQLGVALHVGPGEEVLCDARAHIARAEMGAHGALHGVTMRTWVTNDGVADAAQITNLLEPDAGPYLVSTRCVALENTHNFGGGTIQPLPGLQRVTRICHDLGVKVHLDGARLWNAHVTDVYPAFKLGNADTTKQVLVKHLICACTGLPRQDYEWLFEGEKQTPETVMSTLATMQPTSGFGELFQYSNPLAAAAGFIGGQIANPGSELGNGYDKAMQALVFDPLAMTNTTFDYAVAQTGNYAAPHGYDIDHHVQVMGMGLNDTIRSSRPAGAAWSTVDDLLKYVQMEIRKGLLPDGKRYIGEAALLQRRQPQIALGVDRDYAMALMVDKSDGVTVVDHGGDMDGFHSNMMWWPEQKVGAVILTNADEGYMLRGPFKRRLMEIMFDGEPQALATADANAKASKASWDAQRKLLQYPADASALAGLAPRYHSDALGDIVVTTKDGKAWFDVGAFKSEVTTSPQTDGSVAFVMIDPVAAGFLLVRADVDGKRRLIARDGQHEYVFDEVKMGGA